MISISYSRNYVDDEIGYLTKESIRYINDVVRNLEKETGGQIYVVTRRTIGDEKIENFCSDYFRSKYSGIGDKEKNNGILIAIVGDRKWIHVMWGIGFDKRFTDSILHNKITLKIINEFKHGEKEQGILTGVNSSVEIIKILQGSD